MGKLKDNVVKGRECTLTYVCTDGPVTVKCYVNGVNDTLTTFLIPNVDALAVLADKATSVSLYSTDRENRDFTAADVKIMYSKKDPHIIAVGSESRVAYLNNREYPRYPYTATLCYRVGKNNEWSTCKGTDVSYGGCGFTSDEPLHVDDKITILMFDIYSHKQFEFEAIVRHTRLNASGGFTTGVMLYGNCSELTALVDSVMESTIEQTVEKGKVMEVGF